MALRVFLRQGLAILVLCGFVGAVTAHAQDIKAETWDVEFPTSVTGGAQEHFLNGVTSYHLFMFEDAIQHFQTAQQTDPDFAMAYWGEALSHHRTIWSILNVDEGRAALSKLAATPAARAAKAPTEREKAYLASVEVLFQDGPRREREIAYSEAMGRLLDRYPDDIEALALYTLSRVLIYPRATGMAERIKTTAMAQEVLARNPRHPGAPRYLIQSTDDPVHGALGYEAVRALAGWREPGGSESVHIPSHVYMQQGQWDQVSEANIEAFETSMAWTKAHGYALGDLNSHNYGHLLRWQQYAELQRGRRADARATLDQARADYVASDKAPAIGTALYRMWAQYIVETGAGERASVLAADAKADGFFDQVFVLQGVGLGAAMVDDITLAREAADALGAGRGWRMQAEQHQVLGLIALAEGKEAEALQHLKEAVEINEQNILTHGLALPNPSKPTWELYGEVLLKLDRPEEAVTQFERSLETYRRRAASLLGAARANDQLGRRVAATRHYAELAEVWRNADVDLPALREVRQFLSN